MRLASQLMRSPGVRDDDDLVGAEVTKLVLDCHQRIGVADLALRREAVLGGPRERRLEPLARLLALAVDIRRPVVRPRGQDRREHVELDAGSAGRRQLPAKLLTGQLRARHHEDVARPAAGAMDMGSVCRRLQRRPAVCLASGELERDPGRNARGKHNHAVGSRSKQPHENCGANEQSQRERDSKGIRFGLEGNPHHRSGQLRSTVERSDRSYWSRLISAFLTSTTATIARPRAAGSSYRVEARSAGAYAPPRPPRSTQGLRASFMRAIRVGRSSPAAMTRHSLRTNAAPTPPRAGTSTLAASLRRAAQA